ncbi:hypothetical protein J6590_054361 [Homalodisca vitripennis]|nr:hypothetical protein J6590_054361 [Homalodisca vitripennis]
MSQRKCFRDAAHNATPPPLPPITTLQEQQKCLVQVGSIICLSKIDWLRSLLSSPGGLRLRSRCNYAEHPNVRISCKNRLVTLTFQFFIFNPSKKFPKNRAFFTPAGIFCKPDSGRTVGASSDLTENSWSGMK